MRKSRSVVFSKGRWIPITFWFFYRCADKILNQLEIHAVRVIATNGTASQNSAANANRNNLKQIATSLKNHHLTTDPVMTWNLCTYPEYFSLLIFFFYIFFIHEKEFEDQWHDLCMISNTNNARQPWVSLIIWYLKIIAPCTM